MSRFILLDSGPLGLPTNPKPSDEQARCDEWVAATLASGALIAIPEIVNYEIRRELLRERKLQGLGRLDTFCRVLDYLPITTEVMLKAALLWATARQRGKPTADNRALDIDVVLAAQAILLIENGHEAVIATTNTKHLAQFTRAERWQEIG